MCYIAVFTPLITVFLKRSSRLFKQRLWRRSRPGKTVVFLAPLYYGSAVALRLLQVDLNSLKAVALIGVIHGVAEVIERSVIVLIDYIYHQIYERWRLSWESFWTARRERLAIKRYCHNEYAIRSKCCYLRERLPSLAWIFLHQGQGTTGIISVVCDRYSSSTSYRVVLHVFKYSYGDSISEQANYGSLARAMEKALYSCNCKCIGDSDLGYTGKIPWSKKLLWITVYSFIAEARRQELHMIIIRKMPQWSRTLVV